METGTSEAARRPFDRSPAGVTFVVTTGTGSLDLYAQKLAERLPVPTLALDGFQRTGDLFGSALLSTASLRQIVRDAVIVRGLRGAKGPLHLPNHHLSRYGPLVGQPYVVTVHDVIRYLDVTREEPLIHRPNLRDRLYIGLDVGGIRRAEAVITPSEATKRDVVRHLGVPDERIAVVYEGVDHDVFQPTDRRVAPSPYVLFVGSEHPRKNLATIFRALARLKREPRFASLKLVKVGPPGGSEAPFRAQTLAGLRASGLASEDVVFIGHATAGELAAYYAGAACFLFPSLYEGFGLPPLEAMACGCPVVVSDTPALREIAGEAACLVPATDDRVLAEAIAAVATDESVARDLRSRGLAHARHFSWERAAQDTVRAYERLL
ncbi:MAG: glycosyltransferase family 4 protein [Actinomycetota bacterium]|nr:glycosyltransferase family 4 protein [Actinomycetota bacterium]